MAITAAATARGRRFVNTAGAHEAAVDYALGIGLVDGATHARLDALREFRHSVNYPEDLIEPSAKELAQVAALVEHLLGAAADRLTPPRATVPKRIPPPPRP